MMRKCFATLLILIFVLSWISGCANLDVKIDNVYIVSNAVKYLQDEEVPDTGADRLTARLAKNEAEGMQFIVKPNQTISNVKMTVSELKDGQGNQFAAENVDVIAIHANHSEALESVLTAARGIGIRICAWECEVQEGCFDTYVDTASEVPDAVLELLELE